jgi:hypothetical protein
MRILKRHIIVILLCTSVSGFSQNWQSLNGSLCSGDATAAFGDTINNILYAAGFITCAGGVPVNNIAQWNGTSWDSLAHGSYINGFVERNGFGMYGGKMVCPCFAFGSHYWYICSWNGIKWDSIGTNFCINVDSSGGFDGVAVLNGELYAYGTFDTINHVYYNGIAKWDGTNWAPIGFPYRDSGLQPLVESLALYNGNLYAGGRFTDSLNNRKYIAKFDGTHWSIPGTGFAGGADDVFDLEVYKNELYAGGSFSVADGNITNGIAKWNDTIWKPVGGGITGSYGFVNDLLLYNNKLYAGGTFDQMGGVRALSIAAWDGTNWCGLGDTTHIGVSVLATINHNLFITTGTIWDGDTVNGVAQWIGGSHVDTCGHVLTGINEVQVNNESLNIYPNPASNQITIEFENLLQQNYLIEIRNVLGQIVYSETMKNISGKQTKNIDLSMIESGVYFVRLQGEKENVSKKFIKQ